jgi:hypothetical protein
MTHAARILVFAILGGALIGSGDTRAANAPKSGDEKDALEHVSAETRLDYLKRAQVWRPTNVAAMDVMAGPQGKGAFAFDEQVTCEYVDVPPGGTSPKFGCRLPNGDLVKVKYGRANGEVYAEVAASRLFWALGFGADVMYPVSVTCLKCPIEPWFYRPPQRVKESRYEMAIIERKFEGIPIETGGDKKGWSWKELDLVDPSVGGASKAERDAFALLAVLVQHGDNKADQQRLVCLPDGIKVKDGEVRCLKPFLMVQDLGATFGGAGKMSNSKWELDAWAKRPIWKDPARCVGELDGSMVGTMHDPTVSEAGRKFLADLLSQLRDEQILDLFRVARADRRHPSAVKEGRDLVSEWADVFKRKRSEIVDHQCPS